MKKRFFASLLIVLTLICCFPALCAALSPVDGTTRIFVLVSPETALNVRLKPSIGSEKIGKAYLGYSLYTDGTKRNGFLHVVDCPYEYSEGWVRAEYVTYSEVEYVACEATVTAKGRVACREGAGGERKKWLKPGKTVNVYATSDGWAITDEGYIKTDFLTLQGTSTMPEK